MRSWCGVITDRDLVMDVLAHEQHLTRKPLSETLFAAPRTPPRFCFADEQITEAERLMREWVKLCVKVMQTSTHDNWKGVRRLLVLDRHNQNQLVGVISIDDLARHVSMAQTGQVLSAVSATPVHLTPQSQSGTPVSF